MLKLFLQNFKDFFTEELSRTEAADCISRFLDNVDGPWEWDDFCSVPKRDPTLEKIRLICANLHHTHPPEIKGHYTNADGIKILKNFEQKLRE